MEIETQNGRKIPLHQTSITEFGRGRGFNTDERTVSRHHVTFKPPKSQRVQFQVIGKNPIWVSRNHSEIKVFRSGDEGEMEGGDLFCVSGKNPVWFNLKTTNFQDEKTSSSNNHVVDDDSDIDLVKEFGFLILGHEFDQYPQRMIRDVQTWDWFLEEARKDSDDDDDDDISEKKRSSRKKRKNAIGIDDDEWTGDSDDEREGVLKPKKLQRPNYSTRSKDQGTKSLKKSITSKHDEHKKSIGSNEDEEDETLGGFIVDDEEVGQPEEEEEGNDEDEEEEFDEDEVDE